ncbi:uncharacterized protein BJ212DRAFT_126215 [Suillus subaureus]|uniref:F-box domain-containing protein n=1 Tax=Suillus subaureus TaxID=48587 RepID=A0A9P7EDG1_9AGAM|nr:uncharacterized protein BJ212DRAFT_126215 [Suillus subaureus]KAG1818144.1 hypothetical protein BJ212DRAFT_126215 [Suillus subaureus]
MPQFTRRVFKVWLLPTSLASYSPVMEPAISFRFSDLPLEIALLILKYAARPTFSQREKYADKNPYATALSLCLVSRLVRRTILPEFLHTISLHRCDSMRMFATTLLIQEVYAIEKSDLFFDYTSAVQRMWISHNDLVEQRCRDSESKLYLNLLVPVLLAAPALAIDWYNLKLVVQIVEDVRTSCADLDADRRHALFPGKTQSLTIMGHCINWDIFKHVRKGSVFLASIPHLTYLANIGTEGDIFRDFSMGLVSPEHPLRAWMRDIPWACMKSLETFSVVYPHLDAPYDILTYIDDTVGLDLHVERLTVSASLFRQDPASFPWVTPPFPVTRPGEKSTPSNGVSFEVTQDRANFWQFFYMWDKVWACGLAD